MIDVSKSGPRKWWRPCGSCRPDGAGIVIYYPGREVYGVSDVVPAGLDVPRIAGRYVLCGLVNSGADVTIDADVLVKRWITFKRIR